METVANIRADKNLAELRAEYQANKAQKSELEKRAKKLEELIAYHLNEVEEHKKAIDDCLEQKLYSFMGSYGCRLEKTSLELYNANMELNNVKAKLIGL